MRFWWRKKTPGPAADAPAEGRKRKRAWILIPLAVFVALGGVEALILLIGWAILKLFH
jgi:hypothetical protein